MAINQDTLNAIISGLNTMPKKSEIDTPTNNIDLLATSTTDGLMSSSDKSKLDGIAVGANKYVHPETSGNKHIPSGGSDGQILKWESDGTAKWATETKYGLATETSGGLMSSTDKINLDAAVSKLSGIAEGANNYSLPIASNSQLGGVKTTSTVTNTSGLTACPIIDGVPYYMDTVGSYTLPTASNTTLGGVTTTSNVTSTTALTPCPIIAGVPYYKSDQSTAVNYTDGIIVNSNNVANTWSTQIQKIGCFVNFIVNMTVNRNTNYKIELGSLPESVRPIDSITHNTSSNRGDNCYIYIDPNGKFGFVKSDGSSWAADDGVRACITYLTTPD